MLSPKTLPKNLAAFEPGSSDPEAVAMSTAPRRRGGEIGHYITERLNLFEGYRKAFTFCN
jgi:hypothetical protein